MYYEFITTGNLFLEVVWKQDRSQGLAGLYVIPSRYMRLGKPKEMGEDVSKYMYCRDWANWRKAGVVEFCEFDPNNYTDRQIVHIKQYQNQGVDFPDLVAEGNIGLMKALNNFDWTKNLRFISAFDGV